MLRAHGVSERGRVRPTNQDCFAIDERLRLCLVADGMGGHNAGEVAARIAVDAVLEYVRAGQSAAASRADSPGDWPLGFDGALSSHGNLLRTAMYLAHLQVLESAALVDAYAGMGTTVVAALVVDGRLVVAHAGDSRLYVFAGGRLRQETDDDSWVAMVMASDPRADAAVLRHHPMRNALTNVVGARRRTEVHVRERPLSGGERLLLSTDGVHGVLDDARIARILTHAADPAAAAHGLVTAALARGSGDNCTAVVAEYAA